MARRKLIEAIDQLRKTVNAYAFGEEEPVIEITFPNEIADDVVEALGGEASRLDGLITDADSPVADLSVKAPQALAEYNGVIISKRRI